MSEELIEVMRFLSAGGYVVRTPQDYYIFTNKFYIDFTSKDVGIVPSRDVAIAKSITTHIAVPIEKITPQMVREQYMQFILTCRIPRRIVNPRGDSYDANQFSEKGAKAFGKILHRVQNGDIEMDILIKSTQLYYRSSVSYKLKIGNYIADGAWESYYQAMIATLSSGTVEQHINQELKDDNTGVSRYQLESGTRKGVSLKLQGKGK